ncbi:PAS domain S-box protein [Paenibacillus hamazuiensis]|uniref:PAS domain S-box protein n=1 Tax=Paenibacillus hamazuiensis TaxID=2936508 RepID=UPI00200DCF29|nr:PAS domain S-box protein [Paenibacillus hamazuiensis]
MTKTFDAEKINRLEKEYKLARAMVEALTHNPTVAFIVCRLDDTVLFVNDTFEDLFGWGREEVLNRKLPVVPERMAEDFGAALRTKNWQIGAYETWKKRKDGSEFIVSESIVPLRFDGETLESYACIIRDITKRKQDERLL